VFDGFGQAKFADSGSVLGSCQFSIPPQLLLKMMLSLKLVKIDSIISNSLCLSNSLTHSVLDQKHVQMWTRQNYLRWSTITYDCVHCCCRCCCFSVCFHGLEMCMNLDMPPWTRRPTYKETTPHPLLDNYIRRCVMLLQWVVAAVASAVVAVAVGKFKSLDCL